MTERGRGRLFQPKYKNKRTGESKQAAVWWMRVSVRGKKRRESTGLRNRSKAVEFMNQWLAGVIVGRPTGPSVKNTKFTNLARMLLENYRIHGRRSLERVKRALAHLEKYFGEDFALEITTDRITSYSDQRQRQKAANATINRELAALKRMFRLGERAGKVAQRPYIEMLHEANVRKGFVEWPGFQAIVEYLPEDLRPAFETAYITGWRIKSELLTRQRTHVDLVNGWLRLEPGESKNDEGRQFPLTPELRVVLERQLSRTREIEKATGQVIPWLFHRDGRPIKSLRRAWRTACRRAGLSGLIPHDLRRTAVRNLERAGVSRSAAMKMVGHKTQSIYSRYAIADETMLQEGAAKLSALHAHEADAARVVVPITEARSRSGKVWAKSGG